MTLIEQIFIAIGWSTTIGLGALLAMQTPWDPPEGFEITWDRIFTYAQRGASARPFPLASATPAVSSRGAGAQDHATSSSSSRTEAKSSPPDSRCGG